MLTLTQTKALLNKLNLKPSKKFGQNFLVDGNIVRKSIKLAEIKPNENIVEIGSGLGTLTTGLLTSQATVFAIEIENDLVVNLQNTLLKQYQNTFHIIHGDAVKSPLASLVPKKNELFKIVANLPYSITTPWLDAVLNNRLPIKLVLMVQKEAADRIISKVGCKSFCPISIFSQASYEIKIAHRVSRRCFYPEPKIDSVVIELNLKTHPVVFSLTSKEMIRDIFKYRRKQIGTIIRQLSNYNFLIPIMRDNGIDLKCRPENIPNKFWHKLYNF